VVGAWPHLKSMRRAARYDGWLPAFVPKSGHHETLTPDILREGVTWIADAWRSDGLDSTYEIVVEGTTTGSGAPAAVRPWAEAGATWWLEANWVVEPHDVMEITGPASARDRPACSRQGWSTRLTHEWTLLNRCLGVG
jgi:hypothetical protein